MICSSEIRAGAGDSRDFQVVNTSAEAASENSLVKTEVYSLIQSFILSLNKIMEHLCGAFSFAIYFTRVSSGNSVSRLVVSDSLRAHGL